jgi:23S rRNA (guanosine2251-2'-O)-methyltransferase
MTLIPGLPASLTQLREHGIWSIGLDDRADRVLWDIGQFADTGVCLVLGAEGRGLSRLVGDRCDVLVSIPMAGGVSSLNVSSAAALATYEVSRSRQNRP